MGTISSKITSLTIVYSTVYSDAYSPHKWPVTRKLFPFDDVIINLRHFCVKDWNQILYVSLCFSEKSWALRIAISRPESAYGIAVDM